MTGSLPIWAQPHPFRAIHLDPASVGLTHPSQLEVFTFGLVLADLHTLAAPEGVRRFGRRWGYEWLPSLAADVRNEQNLKRGPTRLQRYLIDSAGFNMSRGMALGFYADENATTSDPDEKTLTAFANTDGTIIREWALNAFGGLDRHLGGWADGRRRVESGYEQAAVRRLEAARIPHRLVEAITISGEREPARAYTSLYQRAALELEDLAVLQPRLRACRLCHQAFIPLRKEQQVCAHNVYLARGRTTIARCVPSLTEDRRAQAERDDYRRRRKTAWTRMRRTQQRHGIESAHATNALAEWELWKESNPPPRPRGRPALAPLPPDSAGTSSAGCSLTPC